jgi:hypothetical protein
MDQIPLGGIVGKDSIVQQRFIDDIPAPEMFLVFEIYGIVFGNYALRL